MAKTVLPEILREDIKELLRKGYAQEAVFKFVEKSAESFVKSFSLNLSPTGSGLNN